MKLSVNFLIMKNDSDRDKNIKVVVSTEGSQTNCN